MKKLITALMGTGLLLSCNAFAYSSECGNTGYTNLSSPKLCGGFYLGLTGQYFQPSGTNSDLNSVNFNFADFGLNVYRSEARRFDHDYQWEYEVFVGYDIGCTANNIELAYQHLNNTDNLHNDLVDGPFSYSEYFFANVNIPAQFIDSATTPFFLTGLDSNTSLEYTFDKVDLTVGHHFHDVCGGFKLHPSIGVRYAKVDHHYRNNLEANLSYPTFAPADVLFPYSVNNGVDSKFNGAGPVFGLDARYGCFGGFGLVGHFDYSVLAGRVNSSSYYTFNISDPDEFLDASPILSAVERFETPKTNRLVANYTTKLGVDYSYCFCNKSSLSFELGYQASKYFDAIDLIRGNIAQAVPNVVAGSVQGFAVEPQYIIHTDTNNFDFRGPYLNVTFRI